MMPKEIKGLNHKEEKIVKRNIIANGTIRSFQRIGLTSFCSVSDNSLLKENTINKIIRIIKIMLEKRGILPSEPLAKISAYLTAK